MKFECKKVGYMFDRKVASHLVDSLGKGEMVESSLKLVDSRQSTNIIVFLVASVIRIIWTIIVLEFDFSSDSPNVKKDHRYPVLVITNYRVMYFWLAEKISTVASQPDLLSPHSNDLSLLNSTFIVKGVNYKVSFWHRFKKLDKTRKLLVKQGFDLKA